MIKQARWSRGVAACFAALAMAGVGSCTDDGASPSGTGDAQAEPGGSTGTVSGEGAATADAPSDSRNYAPARVVPFEFPTITGTALPLSCDDCATRIETPFPIRVGGVTPGQSTLFIGSNGVLSFSAPFANFTNEPLPSAFTSSIIAPYWDDLIPANGGSVQFGVLGAAPNRQLVIEYDNVAALQGQGSVTLQVVFFESSPDIRFNYASPLGDSGASATVGVQVALGVAQQFSFGTPSVSRNVSLLWALAGATANLPPIAVPSADFRVATNLTGHLDATASRDPDGSIASYHWTQLHGEPVQIVGADAATATFTAPATAQALVFALTVVDDHGLSGSATVVVDVFANAAPIADAGQNRIVRPGSTVTLDGAASHDPDGAIVSYQWTTQACVTAEGACSVVLAGADTARPQLAMPPAAAVIVLALTVTDDAGATASDTITLGAFLQPPAAVVTAATSCVLGGSTVTLDASHSVDLDGAIAGYAWSQVSGPPVVIAGAGSAIASVTAPAQGTLVFQLTVTDSDGLIGTSQVTIPIDAPPVARASASAPAVVAGTTVTLDASQSTGATSFFWRQIAGTTAVLGDASAVAPTFVPANPPAAFETVTFEVTAIDACGAASKATVSVIVVAR